MARFISATDESSGKNRRDTFFFGGWVGPEEDWVRFFVPAWAERVLAGPPRIPYLHMTEIRSRAWREQWGLSEMDADNRVNEAFVLLDQMQTLYPVGLYLDAGFHRDRFRELRIVSEITGGAKSFDPDYLCFLAYAYTVLSYVETTHADAEAVDFLVEMNGQVTKYIQEFHATLGQGLGSIGHPSLAKLVGRLLPAGKESVPLQVSDLLLWYSARDKNSLSVDDQRRYYKIAHRKGSRINLSNDLLSRMEQAFSPKARVTARGWWEPTKV